MSVRVLVSLADAELTDIRKGSAAAAAALARRIAAAMETVRQRICWSAVVFSPLDMPQNAYEAIVYVLNM